MSFPEDLLVLIPLLSAVCKRFLSVTYNLFELVKRAAKILLLGYRHLNQVSVIVRWCSHGLLKMELDCEDYSTYWTSDWTQLALCFWISLFFFWFAGIKGASASQGIWTGLFTYIEIAKAKYLASTGGPFLGATAWKYGCRSL